MDKRKSRLPKAVVENAGQSDTGALILVAHSYYVYCLEMAFANILQARMVVAGDVVDTNHELPKIQRLIAEAIEAS